MKTAISIPDDVFAAAERAARIMRVSRSEFFTRAARHMVRRQASKQLTARINKALAGAGDRGLDAQLAAMQAAALADEKW